MPAEVFAGMSYSQLGTPVHIAVCQDIVIMELLLRMYCLYTMYITGVNIPPTGPLKVTGLSVTESGAGGNLIVTWSIPQSDLPITNYTVQYRARVTEQWRSHSVSPPSNSTLLTGLDAGAVCIVRVRAVSVIGDGEWSEEIMRCDDSECLWSMQC